MAELELTGVTLNIKDVDTIHDDPPPSRAKLTTDHKVSGSFVTIPFMQKLIAEMLGTYFIVFAGCAALVVNAANDKALGVPGISIVWGLVVMVMVYAVGHISGAHFNPAVSIAFAICKRFPFKELPAYISAQVLGSILANATLRLIFTAKQDYFAAKVHAVSQHQAFYFAATIPAGSQHQAFVVEFIITFYLMFVICAVATDTRAIGELAGLAVGATVLLNAMFAGPISGASMNPARSLGSAILTGQSRGIWIYLLGPTFGAISGACVYDIIRFNAGYIIRFNASHAKSNTNIDDPDA